MLPLAAASSGKGPGFIEEILFGAGEVSEEIRAIVHGTSELDGVLARRAAEEAGRMPRDDATRGVMMARHDGLSP